LLENVFEFGFFKILVLFLIFLDYFDILILNIFLNNKKKTLKIILPQTSYLLIREVGCIKQLIEFSRKKVLLQTDHGILTIFFVLWMGIGHRSWEHPSQEWPMFGLRWWGWHPKFSCLLLFVLYLFILHLSPPRLLTSRKM